MTRSKRKTAICGITAANSEKQDKALSHRKIRRAVKVQVKATEDSLMPLEKQLTNPWSMSKDGKCVFDPLSDPKLMRK